MPNIIATTIFLPAAALVWGLMHSPVQAKTMVTQTACTFDKMALCVSLAGPNTDACDAARDAFSILPVAMGVGQYLFRINADNKRAVVSGTGDMMGYGMHFRHSGMSYAVRWDPKQPLVQLVRSPDGKPVTAETWTGTCTPEEVDIDAIEAEANR